jgi:hypothetical protein
VSNPAFPVLETRPIPDRDPGVVPPEGLEPSPSAFVALRPIPGAAACRARGWNRTIRLFLVGEALVHRAARAGAGKECTGRAGSRLRHADRDRTYPDNPVASARDEWTGERVARPGLVHVQGDNPVAPARRKRTTAGERVLRLGGFTFQVVTQPLRLAGSDDEDRRTSDATGKDGLAPVALLGLGITRSLRLAGSTKGSGRVVRLVAGFEPAALARLHQITQALRPAKKTDERVVQLGGPKPCISD